MFAEENTVKTFVKFKNLYTSYVTYFQFMASKINVYGLRLVHFKYYISIYYLHFLLLLTEVHFLITG